MFIKLMKRFLLEELQSLLLLCDASTNRKSAWSHDRLTVHWWFTTMELQSCKLEAHYYMLMFLQNQAMLKKKIVFRNMNIAFIRIVLRPAIISTYEVWIWMHTTLDWCTMSCGRSKVILCHWNSRNKEFNHAFEICVNSHRYYVIEFVPLLASYTVKTKGGTRKYHMPQLGFYTLEFCCMGLKKELFLKKGLTAAIVVVQAILFGIFQSVCGIYQSHV